MCIRARAPTQRDMAHDGGVQFSVQTPLVVVLYVRYMPFCPPVRGSTPTRRYTAYDSPCTPNRPRSSTDVDPLRATHDGVCLLEFYGLGRSSSSHGRPRPPEPRTRFPARIGLRVSAHTRCVHERRRTRRRPQATRRRDGAGGASARAHDVRVPTSTRRPSPFGLKRGERARLVRERGRAKQRGRTTRGPLATRDAVRAPMRRRKNGVGRTGSYRGETRRAYAQSAHERACQVAELAGAGRRRGERVGVRAQTEGENMRLSRIALSMHGHVPYMQENALSKGRGRETCGRHGVHRFLWAPMKSHGNADFDSPRIALKLGEHVRRVSEGVLHLDSGRENARASRYGPVSVRAYGFGSCSVGVCSPVCAPGHVERGEHNTRRLASVAYRKAGRGHAFSTAVRYFCVALGERRKDSARFTFRSPCRSIESRP
ncbi:hypothetical protein BC628DRAFT_253696 [Trametes gibbosa]|nr:hypothetical protein BC628DRAFT_253696 [Trametes gibbosa]